MKVIETIAEMKQARRELQGSVGFVPTMGYLHAGHLSLVRTARAENDLAVVSIFVNPTQFLPHEDLDKYPHDIPRDLKMLESVETDIVFIPTAAEMYPPGYDTWVEVDKITRPMEGAIRHGHFRGVTTVVAKLFNIVDPTRAYFGQKDAQQALVLSKMALDLNMNLEVITLPTVREFDGLAMSSRNTYLNQAERKASTVLYRALMLAQQLFYDGETEATKIRNQMTEMIRKESLANVEYVSIAEAHTLEELKAVKPPALVSLAVRFGKTRLIDNIMLT